MNVWFVPLRLKGSRGAKLAARYEIGEATAINWLRRFRQTGSVAPGRMGGHKPKTLSGKIRDWLLERCRSRDFTLRGLVVELAERDVLVDYHSVWDFVHAEGLTHKEHSSRASRNDRT